MNPTNIRNIILDLGGVIINLDIQKPINELKKLFSENYATLEASILKQNLINEFETGKISSEEFILFFQNFNTKVSSNKIKKIWNSMLLDIPKERIELIRKLALKYNVYLLSNTNEIHLECINNYLFNTFQLHSIDTLFKKTYFSFQVGLRKPNPKIFDLVLQENKLVALETLFVDDSIEHTHTAEKLGIHAKHLNDSTLTTYFNEN